MINNYDQILYINSWNQISMGKNFPELNFYSVEGIISFDIGYNRRDFKKGDSHSWNFLLADEKSFDLL